MFWSAGMWFFMWNVLLVCGNLYSYVLVYAGCFGLVVNTSLKQFCQETREKMCWCMLVCVRVCWFVRFDVCWSVLFCCAGLSCFESTFLTSFETLQVCVVWGVLILIEHSKNLFKVKLFEKTIHICFTLSSAPMLVGIKGIIESYVLTDVIMFLQLEHESCEHTLTKQIFRSQQ